MSLILPLGLKHTPLHSHDPAVSSSPLLALIAHWRCSPSLPTVRTCIHLHEVVECSTFTVSPPGHNSLITPFSFITSLTWRPPFSHVVHYSEVLCSIILLTSLQPAIIQMKCSHSSFDIDGITLKKKCSLWITYLRSTVQVSIGGLWKSPCSSTRAVMFS